MSCLCLPEVFSLLLSLSSTGFLERTLSVLYPVYSRITLLQITIVPLQVSRYFLLKSSLNRPDSPLHVLLLLNDLHLPPAFSSHVKVVSYVLSVYRTPPFVVVLLTSVLPHRPGDSRHPFTILYSDFPKHWIQFLDAELGSSSPFGNF